MTPPFLLLTISDNPERQLIYPVWKVGAATVLRPLHPPSGPIPHRSADLRESPAACLRSVVQGVCQGESVMSPIGCCRGRYRLSAGSSVKLLVGSVASDSIITLAT